MSLARYLASGAALALVSGASTDTSQSLRRSLGATGVSTTSTNNGVTCTITLPPAGPAPIGSADITGTCTGLAQPPPYYKV